MDPSSVHLNKILGKVDARFLSSQQNRKSGPRFHLSQQNAGKMEPGSIHPSKMLDPSSVHPSKMLGKVDPSSLYPSKMLGKVDPGSVLPSKMLGKVDPGSIHPSNLLELGSTFPGGSDSEVPQWDLHVWLCDHTRVDRAM